ncbi:hypothetical protein V2J09_014955 [Rumex salicifolius]
MLDIGDPAFKLFGKTIPLVSFDEVSGDCTNAAVSSELSEKIAAASLQSRSFFLLRGQVEQKPIEQSVLEEDPIKDELDEDNHTASKKDTNSSEDQNSLNSNDENSAAESQKDDDKVQGEKSLKKPDKILPCPRCNSMDTKFCYYNNYNVNQPRHFCKSCQRYWTAGGTMRNVPVGAGRRKNKTSSSKYCHLSISEALRAARFDLSNGLHHPHKQPESALKMNGTVLSFGADSPLCDSMASMMNLGEKKVLNGTRNRDDSLVTTSSSIEESALKGGLNPVHPIPHNMQGFTGHHVFPGFQLAYTVPLATPPPPPPLPPPGFFPPMPFYPAPYWNGAAVPWNMPWVSSCSITPKSPGSNPASPTLGKHSREDDTLMTPTDVEKSLVSPRVLVPKTLRIDDPEEAAKSSIWTTLGIKKVEPVGNGGFFKGLQSKSEDKNHKMKSFPVLNTNPAALARSVSFQETS